MKAKKLIGISIILLLCITFLVAFIYRLTSIDEISPMYNSYSFYKYEIAKRIIESIAFPLIALVSISFLSFSLLTKKFTNKKIVRSILFIIFVYLVIASITSYLTAEDLARFLAKRYKTQYYLIFTYNVIASFSFLISSIKWKYSTINTILGIIGYVFFFISLVSTAILGVKNFDFAFLILLFIIDITGFIHLVISNIDFKKILENL